MFNEEKVMVFIDGSNLYHIIRDMFSPEEYQQLKAESKNFNYEKLLNHIARGRKIIRTYFYTSSLDKSKDEQTFSKQQKFFEKLKRIPNLYLVLCRMQKQRINGKDFYHVKEDDIRLAIDMIKLGYNSAYDTAVLISSDSDFIPAVRTIREIGKNIENIGFENKFSYHLQQECDRFLKLKKETIKSFFD